MLFLPITTMVDTVSWLASDGHAVPVLDMTVGRDRR
jgi:hypothetical protein